MEATIKFKIANVDGHSPEETSRKYVHNLLLVWMTEMQCGAVHQVENPGTGEVIGEFVIDPEDITIEVK